MKPQQKPEQPKGIQVDQGLVIQQLVAKIGALELENATLKVLARQNNVFKEAKKNDSSL